MICEKIADGMSLRDICLEDGAPHRSTVFRWLSQHPDFNDQYGRAREAQAELLADELMAISDDGQNDTYLDEDGKQRTDHDVIARSKLRVDTRKWIASKLKPKVYGDRQQLDISGTLAITEASCAISVAFVLLRRPTMSAAPARWPITMASDASWADGVSIRITS